MDLISLPSVRKIDTNLLTKLVGRVGAVDFPGSLSPLKAAVLHAIRTAQECGQLC